jgi:hypothetical protein
MGLFGRKKDPRKELAEAIARRGVRTRGKITGMRPLDGPNEFEFTISYAPEGQGTRTVLVQQAMAPQTLHGLAAGEPVELSYDRDDPSVAMVWGSPHYRVIEGNVVRVEDVPPGA